MRESRLGAKALVRRDALIEEQREAERTAKREAAADAARLAEEEAAQGVAQEEVAQGMAQGVAHQPLEGVAHQPLSIGAVAGGAVGYMPPGGGGCGDEVPDDFICPITAELMHDPVSTYSLWPYLLAYVLAYCLDRMLEAGGLRLYSLWLYSTR